MIRYLSFWNCILEGTDKSELVYRLNLRFQALLPDCPGLLRDPGHAHPPAAPMSFSNLNF